MKIAFDMMGNSHWTAGFVYLRNLFATLQAQEEEEIEIHVVSRGGRGVSKKALEFLGVKELLYGQVIPEDNDTAKPNDFTATSKLSDIEPGLLRVLEKNNIDIFFGSPYAHNNKSIATLTYLPDFQHVAYPQFFLPSEIEHRNQYFKKTIAEAMRVIVPGKSQFEALEQFDEHALSKARLYHPLSIISKEIYEKSSVEILKKYHLPEKFIYIPNQFWKHKNHENAFKALSILKADGHDVALVCSGNPHDYRFPTLFGELSKMAAEKGIAENIKYIGIIPHEDVLLLMRQSVCVMNPSLYEGFGMSINEAFMLGKEIIASDIPALRERCVHRGIYFNPLSPDDIAEKMLFAWQEWTPGPSKEFEKTAREKYDFFIKENAKKFLLICREVCGVDEGPARA